MASSAADRIAGCLTIQARLKYGLGLDDTGHFTSMRKKLTSCSGGVFMEPCTGSRWYKTLIY